ncbi:MAG: N-acetylmuramoyl-L-alanine amidase [Pseudomonadota bacterium]
MNIIKNIQREFAKRGEIKQLVLHHTKVDFATTISLLQQPDGSCAHYVVDVNGAIYQLASDDSHVGHAGISYWRGQESLNSTSIGIEIVNNGVAAYPKEQIASVIALSKRLINKYSIEPANVVGHSDIAPARKDDPGVHFPWGRLFEHGVGMYVDTPPNLVEGAKVLAKLGDRGEQVQLIQQFLARIGYQQPLNTEFDGQMLVNVLAFRVHFVPYNISPVWDVSANEVAKELNNKFVNI